MKTDTPAHLAPPSSDKYAVLGKLAWLWMNSGMHRHWPVELLSRFVLPPIELGQYVMLERDGLPIAYCSWALMNQRAEFAYMSDPSYLGIEDWNGGTRIWFVDWIAPFSKRDSLTLRGAVADRFPDSVGRSIHVKPGSDKAKVTEFKGRRIDNDTAQKILTGYADDFLRELRSRQATA